MFLRRVPGSPGRTGHHVPRVGREGDGWGGPETRRRVDGRTEHGFRKVPPIREGEWDVSGDVPRGFDEKYPDSLSAGVTLDTVRGSHLEFRQCRDLTGLTKVEHPTVSELGCRRVGVSGNGPWTGFLDPRVHDEDMDPDRHSWTSLGPGCDMGYGRDLGHHTGGGMGVHLRSESGHERGSE